MPSLRQKGKRCRSHSSPQRQSSSVLEQSQLATTLRTLPQWLEAESRETIMSLEFDHGNEKLWLAVIKQAYDDALSANLDPRKIKEARDWFIKPNRNFEDVCLWADKDPARVRKAAIKAFQHAETNPKPKRQPIGSKLITLDGQTKTISEWAIQSGLSVMLIYNRLYNGMSYEEAITKAKVNCKNGRPKLTKPKPIYESNKREAKIYSHDGQSLTLCEWAKLKGLMHATLYRRVHILNWNFDNALNTPVRAKIKFSTDTAPSTHAGVGQNFSEDVRNRRGWNAQYFPETEFSKIKELTE
jgi:hypothetical protein